MSGNTQLEEIITLRNEVREVLHSGHHDPLLSTSILRIKVEDASASEIWGWIFQVYSTCQYYESYDAINYRARQWLMKECYDLYDGAM